MSLAVFDVTKAPPVPVAGGRHEDVKRITFDSSYPTGGEPLTAANLGFSSVEFVDAPPNAGYVFEYDYANAKLLAYYGDNNNASDGPLIEVPDTTSLATIVTRVFVRGVL